LQLHSRKLSYVAQMRQLQRIKEDNSFCSDQLDKGMYLLYSKGKPMLTRSPTGAMSPVWVPPSQACQLRDNLEDNLAVLGIDDHGVAQFALNIGETADVPDVEAEIGGKFTDLRMGLFMVDSVTAHTLTRGWSLLQWKKTLNFCSKCGGRLVRNISASQASCSACNSVYYPTTTPVGIVSINDAAQDRLLLIRQPRYPPGMYSCIAGFLDVGETLEDCVKREAAEEVGIEVTKVSYMGSQHWPFPAGSLMIGCQAEALPGQEPDPCKLELEDARWFTRDQVQEAYDRIAKNPKLRVNKKNDPNEIFVAPKGAIANFLVKSWLDAPRPQLSAEK